MATLLKVEPLLVMGFRMGLGVSPDSGLKLVIVGQGLSNFVRLVVLVIPCILKCPIRNADPSRMTLAANLQTSFVGEFSGMDNFFLNLGRLDVFGSRTMAFFTANIEFHIFGFITSADLFQFKS